MRLGLFMMPLHPPTRTLGEFMAETAEKALLAERLGFDEVWVGEHFSATTEPIPSPLMFMASLIPQTSRITFGTGVINLPNRHPAVVAAEIAQFDHMAPDRFIFGIGTGSLPSDYELFDVADVEKRNRMLIESMDFIERIWAQDPPYEFSGEYWKFGIKKAIVRELGIGYMPKPRRARRAAGLRRGVESEFLHGEGGGAARLGPDLERACAARGDCLALGRLFARLPRRRPRAERRRLAGRVVCRCRRLRCRGARARVQRRELATATPSAISTRCSSDPAGSPISSRAATCRTPS